MKKLLMIGLICANSFAATTETGMICPALSKNGMGIVSNLRSLQEQLKKDPECESIKNKLSNINELVTNENWTAYKDVLLGNEAQDLEGAEVEVMGGLIRNFTSNLMETIDLLNGSGRSCIPQESKSSFLANLATVTNEVSTVVGNITGPYGMAVSLGGNLVSEVINGIDQFFKSNDVYDFSNKDEEILFMNQFCAFTEAQKDVTDLLGMDSRIVELRDLDRYLTVKIQDLVENCPECAAYKLAFEYKVKADKIVERIREDVKIVNNPTIDSESVTYSMCTEIGRAFHTPNSDLSQLFNLFNEYETSENPLMAASDRGLLQQIIAGKTHLDARYPTVGQCWALSRQEEIEISREFNDRLRDDILPLSDSIFGQQKRTFVYLANKKFSNPLGDYIASSMDRKVWIKKQVKDVEAALRDPNRGVDLENVRQIHERLQNRIIGSLMPRYLGFLIARNVSNINAFRSELRVFLNNQFVKYNRVHRKHYPNLSELLVDVKAAEKIDAREFLSEWRAIVDKFNIAHDQRSNIKRYCDYLKYGMNAINGISWICTENVKNIDRAFASLSYQEENLRLLHNFDLWGVEHLNIMNSRVRDYSNYIKAWTERGDERWTPTNTLATDSKQEAPFEQEKQQWENDVASRALFDLN